MGLDNPLHIAFLVVILLLVFGAKRLPEIGRSLGSGMREFKTSVTGEANHRKQHDRCQRAHSSSRAAGLRLPHSRPRRRRPPGASRRRRRSLNPSGPPEQQPPAS